MWTMFWGKCQSSKTNERFNLGWFVFPIRVLWWHWLTLKRKPYRNQINPIWMINIKMAQAIGQENRGNWTKVQIFGSQNKVMLIKVQHNSGQDLMGTTAQGMRVGASLISIYWEPGRKELEKIVSKIRTEFRNLILYPTIPKARNVKNYFLKQLFLLFFLIFPARPNNVTVETCPMSQHKQQQHIIRCNGSHSQWPET